MGRKRVNNIGLPTRVYLRRGRYYYDCPVNRAWINLGDSLEEVAAKIPLLTAKNADGMTAGALFDQAHLSVIFWHARKNARSRGIEFLLTRDDLQALWRRSGGRCELTGIRFDSTNSRGYRRRPFVASIDRVDSKGAYVLGNVRLVVSALNLAMNEWGEEIFRQIARAYLKQSGKLCTNVKFVDVSLPQRAAGGDASV